ncbi:MAG: hypothetical protein JNK63_10180 [Chthonomonas sp.]|nr:hypothetical protein [Chthonomonas sp.]
MRLFVTGFGPFGKIEVNPSSDLARACGLPHEILEVSFQAVDRFLISEFKRSQFDGLLMIGVNARAKTMRLESQGFNACGFHPDVRGIVGNPIISEGGPKTKQSTLWRQEHFELPGFVRSYSAGRYLCNYALYRGLTELKQHRVGFLHVPLAETVSLSDQAERLQRLIAVLMADRSPR